MFEVVATSQTCSNCCFYVVQCCRRYAPKTELSPGEFIVKVFPPVSLNGWCGYWKSIEEN